ncbi:MAG: DUF1566 domain-containing protein [Cytophagales bacterium]|nr:DUF1566 domain-containing protein [Cytophagales bacterium]
MRKETRILKTLTVGLSFLLFAGIVACGDDAVDDGGDEQGDGNLPDISGYPISSTNQNIYYGASNEISAPGSDQSFYGQDANYSSNEPSYEDNGDGTVTDMVTGLMWQQSADTDGDGDIDADDKLTYDEAVAGATTFDLGGYDDWRLPTIKEQYSLILFSGEDPSGYDGTSTTGLVPFIDTDYFDFNYGDTDAGERIIDSQYASSTVYVDYTMNGDETLFGVNFADGRIKGYGMSLFGNDKTFFVTYVRGNSTYGVNDFQNNNDGTITDSATGLMWMQDDNGQGYDWEDALSYAEGFEFAGHTDWRLPDVKELQSLLDYSRSPETTSSAAIDPIFDCTAITNEGGDTDYSYYWSSTTHETWTGTGANASYVSFGRAMGYMNGEWMDVHGAGAQRSDPKAGDPNDYPTGNGPQGDAIRINNYVRLVRYAE